MTDGAELQAFHPPFSAEAEQSVIGAVTMWPACFADIGDKLSAEDFYIPQCRVAYEALQAMDAAGLQVDVVELMHQLEQRNVAEAWIDYVVECCQNTPGVSNVVRYAEIVRERATLRRMVSISQTIIREIHDGRPLTEKLGVAQSQLLDLSGTAADRGPKPIGPLLKGAYQRLEERNERGDKLIGYSCGFSALDARLKGLQRGRLYIVAGRPSMGKTTLAMNMVEHITINQKLPGVVFSLEMPEAELTDKSIASQGRIPLALIADGSAVSHPDYSHRIVPTVSRMMEAGLHIDDSPEVTIGEMRARARRIKQQLGKIGVIMADYLQLMRGEGRTDNREQEISGISRGLKAMAKELDCPVIAISQLNRAVEQRRDKRPLMSDLRESGAIEQDADVILFVYRDEVYQEDSRWKGVAEVICGKWRGGETGTDYLRSHLALSRFDNLEAGWQKPQAQYENHSKAFDG